MSAPATKMRKQFIRMTSGWIPVSMLALLAVALIAAQARGNLPNESFSVQIPLATTSLGAALNAELLRKLESLPASVDTVLVVADNVSWRLDTRILRKELASDQTIRRFRK